MRYIVVLIGIAFSPFILVASVFISLVAKVASLAISLASFFLTPFSRSKSFNILV